MLVNPGSAWCFVSPWILCDFLLMCVEIWLMVCCLTFGFELIESVMVRSRICVAMGNALSFYDVDLLVDILRARVMEHEAVIY